MCQANERRRYIVMRSLIGWAHTQNYPCNVSWKGYHGLFKQLCFYDSCKHNITVVKISRFQLIFWVTSQHHSQIAFYCFTLLPHCQTAICTDLTKVNLPQLDRNISESIQFEQCLCISRSVSFMFWQEYTKVHYVCTIFNKHKHMNRSDVLDKYCTNLILHSPGSCCQPPQQSGQNAGRNLLSWYFVYSHVLLQEAIDEVRYEDA